MVAFFAPVKLTPPVPGNSLIFMSARPEQPTGPTAYLVALDSSFSNREYTINDSGLIIGRDKERSDIILADRTISRQHVSLKLDANGFFFAVDLHSTNGLYVNTKRVDGQVALKEGDIIGLGSPTALHFRFQHHSSRNHAVSYLLSPQSSWTIGRNEDADIYLPFGPTVSAEHARIVCRKNQLFLEDLHSRNGTFLNGRKIRRAKLQAADTVVLGSIYFHFRLTDNLSLAVSQRESGDDIQLECISLNRDVAIGRGKQKRILHDLSLQINPGEFVGILGPSGAGKSTLLKALCGHTVPDSGSVLLNGTPLYRSYDMFRNVIGYVPQDDILHAELSVEKSLEYVVKLRLPGDLDKQQRERIINTTIEALGLSHVRTTPIKQLSGGQRKRVSIGAELLTRPSVLFLDEPTSGLDPSVEDRLMRHFQDMAQKGTTILITTHILYSLSMLDKIIFLAQGRLVFYGTPDEALEFFNDGNEEIRQPTQIFDLLEGLRGNIVSQKNDEENDKKEAIARHYWLKYLQSSYYEKHITGRFSPFASDLSSSTHNNDQPEKTIDTQLSALLSSPLAKSWSLSNLLKCCSFRQWRLLSSRHLRIRFSSLKQSIIYLLIPVVLALVTLTQSVNGFPDEETIKGHRTEIVEAVNRAGHLVEQQLQILLAPEGQVNKKSAAELLHAIKYEGVVNLPIPMGLLLMFVMTSIFMGVFIACQEISSEKSIRYREQMAGQRIVDYVGSKLSFCLLITSIQCTLYLAICYCTPGLHAVPFFSILFVLILLSWTSVTIGLLLSAVDPSSGQFSIILAIIAVLPQLILSGGLGPDFYAGMNRMTSVIADLFPARWGLELFLGATYFNEAGKPLVWIPEFITNTVGFNFGDGVARRGILMLFGQMVFWLLVTSCVLKKNKY